MSDVKVYKIGNRCLRMSAEVPDERYPYRIGFATTPDGVVGFYTQKDVTMLSFAAAGREVRSRIDRSFTERGLMTVCIRFAAESLQRIAEANDQ